MFYPKNSVIHRETKTHLLSTMALLEIIQKKFVKMGAFAKIVRLLPKISLLLTLFSIVFMITLPLDGQYRRTYISENALMPGQAHAFFRESEWNHVRGYRNEVVNMMNLPLTERNLILRNLLDSMGYKTDILNFTDPITGVEKPTLYAIYHVPKGDDTEAMVLTSPWYNDDNELNIGSISMTLGLARYFRRLSIWAKNIIIVFPEDGGLVLRNWVDSYHTSLDHTGGSIECALVIDCPTSSDYIGFIELEYSGVNGQLPNLDYINTIVQVSDNEGIKVSLNGTPFGQLWTNDYFSRLNSMINGVFDIASAGILMKKDHECFSGWNIQSITLRGKEGDSIDITSFGRVVESTFRSVNNLLEKFHQSFFFYLLLGPKTFVSIGMYLPACGLSSASFLIGSLNSWINGDNKLTNFFRVQTNQLIYSSLTFIFFLTIVTSFGIYTSNLSSNLSMNEYETLTYNYFIYPLLLLSILPIIIKIFRIKINVNLDYLRTLNSMVLFFLGYALIGLMVLHFPLSFILSIILSPLNFIRYTNKKVILKKVCQNSLLLFLTCPSVWLMIFSVLTKFHFKFDDVRNLMQYFTYPLLQREIQKLIDFVNDTPIAEFVIAPIELFARLITCYKEIQCWTWIIVCFTWIPVWINMVIISCLNINKQPEIDEEKKNI